MDKRASGREHRAVRRKWSRANPEFAQAMREGRERSGMDREALGARLGYSSRTLKHWETGIAAPPPSRCADVVEALAALEHAWADAVARALRVEPPPAPPSDTPAAAAARRRAANDALYFTAEEHGVAPGALRSAVASLFARLEAAGVALDDARVLLRDRPFDGSAGGRTG